MHIAAAGLEILALWPEPLFRPRRIIPLPVGLQVGRQDWRQARAHHLDSGIHSQLNRIGFRQ